MTTWVRCCATVFLMVGVTGVGLAQGVAEAKRPMTFEDLMAMKRVSDPQISPSGKWVMFSVTEVSLEKNTKVNHLWVTLLNWPPQGFVGGRVPKEQQVTFGSGESNARFSSDGKWVSWTAEDASGQSQIFLSEWNDDAGTVGAGRQLTHLSTGADGAVWSPDSQRLLFVSSVYPECSVKGGVEPAATNVAPEVVGARPAADSSAALRNDKQAAPGNDKQRGGGATTADSSAALRNDKQSALRNDKQNALGNDKQNALGNDKQKGNDKNEAATWAEEDACNKAKDEAAAKSKVKAQVWDSLLYRHWDQYTGKKRSHVLVVSRANGEDVRDLTPASAVGDAEVPTFSLGGPLGYAWAPDSKEIAYVANLDKVPAASTNNDVFTLRLDEPGAKAVKVSTSPGSDDGPQYSPDGKWLAFRSQARAGYESDRFRLMLFDREKKTIKTVDMEQTDYWPPGTVLTGNQPIASPEGFKNPSTHDLDRWIDEFIWSSDSQRIFFTAADQGQEVIYGTNSTGDDLHRYGRFTGGKTIGEWSDLIQIGPGYRLAGVLMRADKPAEIAIANLSEMDEGATIGSPFGGITASVIKTYNLREGVPLATANYLTHLNDALVSSIQMTPLETYRFEGADKTTVEGFVVRPPNFDPSKKYPVKFLIHGGPQGAWGDAWSYRWNPELMAASGYVVVMVNPRGSTGYGQAFIDGVNGDWGGKAYVDLMKGLDAAEAKYPFIDKDRECALGASYGGYMADWILTHTNRFKCIVTHDGMFDPVSAYGATEEMWFNEWEFRRGPATGAAAWDKEPASPWRYQGLPAEQDPFRRWSPMLHIKDAKTPTLVVHSQRDYRLDVSQGFELFTALQRLGVPSKFLYFPDEGHWVLKPQNSQLWYETVGDWCDKWTHSGKYAGKR